MSYFDDEDEEEVIRDFETDEEDFDAEEGVFNEAGIPMRRDEEDLINDEDLDEEY